MKQPLPFYSTLCVLVLGVILLAPTFTHAYTYTTRPNVNLREAPNVDASVIRKLLNNQTLDYGGEKNGWCYVRTISGEKGYVPKDSVSSYWIKIHKAENQLQLMKNNEVVKSFPANVCTIGHLAFAATKENTAAPGRYYISQRMDPPEQQEYGDKALRVSYPNRESARLGLEKNIIDYKTYMKILEANAKGEPPHLSSGTSCTVQIHNDNGISCTSGGIILNKKAMEELFAILPERARLEVYNSIDHDKQLNAPEYMATRILQGAQLVENDTDNGAASSCQLVKITYPKGTKQKKSVGCTDVVIKALLNAKVDLQVLLYEDMQRYPERYHSAITPSDANKDQLHARNLQIFFANYAHVLPADINKHPSSFQPGDIIFLDTGVLNGTEYDHVGLVATNSLSENGGEIIILSTGPKDKENALIDEPPAVVGHFRMGHLFDYQ